MIMSDIVALTEKTLTELNEWVEAKNIALAERILALSPKDLANVLKVLGNGVSMDIQNAVENISSTETEPETTPRDRIFSILR